MDCPRYYSARVNLKAKLALIGINHPSMNILLGGGDFCDKKNVKLIEL